MNPKNFNIPNIKNSLEKESSANEDKFTNAENFENQFHGEPTTKKKETPELVRRIGFSLTPKEEQYIADLQYEASEKGFLPTKSEVLRAGLLQLKKLTSPELRNLFREIERIKKGRR